MDNDKLIFNSLLPKRKLKIPITIKTTNEDENTGKKTLVYILNHKKLSDFIYNNVTRIFQQNFSIHIFINFVFIIFIFLKINFKNQEMYSLILCFFLIYNVFSLTVSLILVKNIKYTSNSSVKNFKSNLITQLQDIDNELKNVLIIESTYLQPHELLETIKEFEEISLNKSEIFFLSIFQNDGEDFILIKNEGYLFKIRYDQRIYDIFKNMLELLGLSYVTKDTGELTHNTYYLLKKGYACFSIYIPSKKLEIGARLVADCTYKIIRMVK